MRHIETKLIFKNNKLRWLKPTFTELSKVVSDYVIWECEPPYWNNETASTSLLVAAASRAGCIALSDYRRAKWDKSIDIRGRCDLLIGKGSHYLEIEVKQIYAGPNSKATGRLSSYLDIAVKDAKRLWWGAKNKRAGLLFAVLSMEKSQTKAFEFSNFECELCKVTADVVWYWFDSSFDQKFRSNKNKQFYPGFALLLKV